MMSIASTSPLRCERISEAGNGTSFAPEAAREHRCYGCRLVLDRLPLASDGGGKSPINRSSSLKLTGPIVGRTRINRRLCFSRILRCVRMGVSSEAQVDALGPPTIVLKISSTGMKQFWTWAPSHRLQSSLLRGDANRCWPTDFDSRLCFRTGRAAGQREAGDDKRRE